MIQGTVALREKFGGTFMSYRQATLEVKEAKTIYSKRQEQIAGEKMTTKQMNNLKIEGRLVQQVGMLKKWGGPFSSQEIDDFRNSTDIEEKVKVKRMKTEVMHTRDTSLCRPKGSAVLRIRSMKLPGHKSRQLTPAEFGENLKILLNKKLEAIGNTVTIKAFVILIDGITKV